MVVFTDACYERDHPTWPCGMGGVVVANGKILYFSLAVDAKLRTLLGEKTKKQIIFEAETRAALLSANYGMGCLATGVWFFSLIMKEPSFLF